MRNKILNVFIGFCVGMIIWHTSKIHTLSKDNTHKVDTIFIATTCSHSATHAEVEQLYMLIDNEIANATPENKITPQKEAYVLKQIVNIATK